MSTNALGIIGGDRAGRALLRGWKHAFPWIRYSLLLLVAASFGTWGARTFFPAHAAGAGDVLPADGTVVVNLASAPPPPSWCLRSLSPPRARPPAAPIKKSRPPSAGSLPPADGC
jgi:hypothetical protein